MVDFLAPFLKVFPKNMFNWKEKKKFLTLHVAKAWIELAEDVATNPSVNSFKNTSDNFQSLKDFKSNYKAGVGYLWN